MEEKFFKSKKKRASTKRGVWFFRWQDIWRWFGKKFGGVGKKSVIASDRMERSNLGILRFAQNDTKIAASSATPRNDKQKVFQILVWLYRVLCRVVSLVDGVGKIIQNVKLKIKNYFGACPLSHPPREGGGKRWNGSSPWRGEVRWGWIGKMVVTIKNFYKKIILAFAPSLTLPTKGEGNVGDGFFHRFLPLEGGGKVGVMMKKYLQKLLSLLTKIKNHLTLLTRSRHARIIGLSIAGLLLVWGLIMRPVTVLLALNLIFLIALNVLLFISYKKDKCIPYLSPWLRKKYLAAGETENKLEKLFEARNQLKIKFLEIGENAIYLRLWPYLQWLASTIRLAVYKVYLKIIYHLALISSSSQESLGLSYTNYNGHHCNYNDAHCNSPEFLRYHRKQKRISAFSLSGLVVMIIATSFSSMILSFVFPNIFKTFAATHTMLQTDWSGGASTTATSTNTSDQTGWTKYKAASSTIDFGASGQITLVASSTTFSETFTATTYNDSTTSTATWSGGQLAQSSATPTSTNLSSKLPSDWAGYIYSMVYDSTNGVIYLGGDGGKFAAYSTTSSLATSRTSAISSFWDTNIILALTFDSTNSVVYLGGLYSGTAKFAQYSTTSTLAANRLSSISSFWGDNNINGMAYDSANGVVYLGGERGSLAAYSTTSTLAANRYSSISSFWGLDGFGNKYSINGINYDSANGVIYFGAAKGKFVQYSPTSTLAFPATSTITSFWGNTATTGPVLYDSNNSVVYFGKSDSAGFAQYSTTSSLGANHTSTISSFWNSGVRTLSYDSTNNVIWLGGMLGRLGQFSATSSLTTANRISLISDFWGEGHVYSSAFDSTNGVLYIGGYNLFASVRIIPACTTCQAVSLTFDTNSQNIRSAKLTKNDTPGTGTATYQLSNDGGTTYSTVTAGTTSTFATTGSDARFKIVTTNNATVQDVTVQYDAFPATSTLISNPFDSEQAGNFVNNLTWTETLPAGTDIKFQIRTSADGVTWSDWLGPTGTGSYYSTSTGNTINSTNSDGSNDRFVQYQVWLTSDGVNTPTLSDVTLTYVVNDAPNYDPNTSVSASQQTSDGYVAISYSVRDTDTASLGVGCPLCVTPSFEYSIDNGSTYTSIVTGLSTNATTTKTVGTSSYTSYSLTWNAKGILNGTYATSTKIRITVDDGEGANHTAVTSTPAFALDVKAPTMAAMAVMVFATSTPATVTLNASDNSALQMCITLDNTQTNCSTYNSTSTISLQTDPDTVYVIFRDAYQNTASASADTPSTPTMLLVRDVSNLATGEYREFVAWKKSTSASFADYKLLRSTDNSNFSIITTISDINVNYYLDSGLSASTTYYYKAAMEDTNGHVSYFSSTLSDTTNGQGGTDATPPNITSVTVATSSPQSAVITWNTDELSSSYVDYGTAAGSFPNTVGVATMRDTSSNAGVHSVGLSSLSPNTTYYYRVRSIDPSGNSATDANGGSGNGYTFTTPSGPVLSAVAAAEVNNVHARIVWTTDVVSNSYVTYSTSSVFTYSLTTGSNSDSVTTHSVSITGLTKGTAYYYYVTSGIGRNDNGGSYYTFTTSNDTTPPDIENITASLIIDTKAVIEWTTDEDADSLVKAGTSSGVYETASSSNAGLGKVHSLTLTGLSASQTYKYIVVSSDANGNQATSTEQTLNTIGTLSTAAQVAAAQAAAAAAVQVSCAPVNICPVVDTTPPVISSIQIGVSNLNAGIKWSTDEEADSIIKFGLKNDTLDQMNGDFKLGFNHNVGLSNLTPGTTYYFTINSADGAGNRATTAVKNFTTLTAAGQAIVLPTEGTTTSTAPPAKTPEENTAFNKAALSAIDTIKQLQGQFSVSGLEETSQNLLRTFASFIPAPILSGEPKVLTTSHEATVVWRTNKPANSMVAFAPEKDFVKSKGDDAYLQIIGRPDDVLTTHSVILRDLQPDTVYHYQVRSVDGVGNAAKSGDFTFKTDEEKLEISDYVVQVVSSDKAIFKWITTIATDSAAKYIPYRNGVLTVEEKKTESDKVITTLHEITLEGLEAGVTYQVELSGRDVDGQTIAKVIPSFSTSKDDLPPIIYQVQTESALSPGGDSKVQTIISWLTNEPSTGQIFYQKGVGAVDENAWVKTNLDPNYTKKHIIVITKFDPGAVYKFKIQDTDSGNNLAESKVYTILSPQQKETVFQIIVNNFQKTFGWTKKLGI